MLSEKATKNPKLLIFSVVFIDLLGFGIMIPMLPFYARHFGADAMEIGFLMFVYSFMQFFLSPYWGRLSDRYGRRPVLLTTIFGQGLAFMIAAFAPSYFILLVSRIFAGAFSANISTANAYMADVTSKEERAKGMGLIGAAFGLGFVFGPAIGGISISYGYYIPSLIAGCLAFANFLWAYKILREPDRSVDERAQNRRRLSVEGINKILSQPKFFVPILSFFLITFAFVQLEITFGLFVLDQFQMDERQAGLLLAFLGVVMAIVQGGLLGKILKFVSEENLVLMGCGFIVLALGSLFFLDQVSVLIVSLVVLAFGYSLANPCLSAITSKSARSENQGTVLGVYQSGASLARVLGPLAAGFLYDSGRRLPFFAGASIVLLAGLVFTFHARKSDNASSSA